MKNLIPIIITFSIFSIIILTTVAFQSYKDSPTAALKPLTVGDQMPAISSTISINVVSNKERLEHSSDQLVILEFINSTCSTCRKSIPYLQELQQTFPDDLNIILITRQQDSVVRADAAHHQWTLPIITEDTTLCKLFPHHTVPHQVWIKNHEVVAITSWQYATADNVQQILNSGTVDTPLKKDTNIDLSQPLLNMNEIQPLFQSAITHQIPNGSGGVRRRDYSLLVYNSSVAELYNYAFGMPNFPTGAYQLLEVNDSLKQMIKAPEDQISGDYSQDQKLFNWKQQYLFSYNIVFPENISAPLSQMRQIMQHDLNDFFGMKWGLSGSIQQRNVPVLALTATQDVLTCKTKGGTPAVDSGDDHFTLINKPIHLLTASIGYRHHYLGMPVVNATGFQDKVDIHLNCNMQDLNQVNAALVAYGLQLTRQLMRLDILVITDQNHSNQNQ